MSQSRCLKKKKKLPLYCFYVDIVPNCIVWNLLATDGNKYQLHVGSNKTLSNKGFEVLNILYGHTSCSHNLFTVELIYWI